MAPSDRYIIISADGHAGGNHAQYREYLDPAWRDEFDAWRGRYKNPFRDLQDDGRSRNWDTARRNADLDAEGIAAEVLFPNTVPPFFPTGVVIAPAPTAEEFPKRLAGLRAHNRWLVDFVAESPERRAGLAQIALNDVDEAVSRRLWAKEQGLARHPPARRLARHPVDRPALLAVYDPFWAACQETGLSITHHAGGSGIPNYGTAPVVDHDVRARVGLLRQPGPVAPHHVRRLRALPGPPVRDDRAGLVVAASGAHPDGRHPQLDRAGSHRGDRQPRRRALPHKPSDYFKRNCFIGASFPPPSEAATFHGIGIDKMMWGSDYPHNEACSPLSRESLRHSFEGWSEEDLHKVLSENAAGVYGFDLDELRVIADRIGPTVEEIATPLDDGPRPPEPRLPAGLRSRP